ncbi:hypothetical protein ES703_75369 [subsurface metagenome]
MLDFINQGFKFCCVPGIILYCYQLGTKGEPYPLILELLTTIQPAVNLCFFHSISDKDGETRGVLKPFLVAKHNCLAANL